MPSRAGVVVLVEDVAQQNLIRRFLERCGSTVVRWCPLAKSVGGSGTKYVADQFPEELRWAKGRTAATLLVVMTDADNLSTAQRRAQLGNVAADDPVAILIPKRHVETWLGALNNQAVDEQTNYHTHTSQFSSVAEIRAAALALFAITRPNQPVPKAVSNLASLLASLPEWRKI